MGRPACWVLICLVSALALSAQAAEPPAAYKDCLASGLSERQTTYQDFVEGNPAR